MNYNLQSRKDAVNKLKRIEGRVKGLVKMFEEDRNGEDILMQISSIHEALRVVGKMAMQSYIDHSVKMRINHPSSEKRQLAYDDFLDTVYKYAK